MIVIYSGRILMDNELDNEEALIRTTLQSDNLKNRGVADVFTMIVIKRGSSV